MHVWIDGYVFAIAAAYVEPDAAWDKGREELFYKGPGFVAGGAEMGGDCFVDGVDVGVFV